jgi:hypothetical protein
MKVPIIVLLAASLLTTPVYPQALDESRAVTVGIGTQLIQLDLLALEWYAGEYSLVPSVSIAVVAGQYLRLEPSFGFGGDGDMFVLKPGIGVFGQTYLDENVVYFGARPTLGFYTGTYGGLEYFALDPTAGFEHVFGRKFGIGFETIFRVVLIEEFYLGMASCVTMHFYF